MDQVIGLLFLAGYIVGIVGLASGITYAVIRIFPTERKPKKDDTPDSAAATNGEAGAGSLFRRSKRGSG